MGASFYELSQDYSQRSHLSTRRQAEAMSHLQFALAALRTTVEVDPGHIQVAPAETVELPSGDHESLPAYSSLQSRATRSELDEHSIYVCRPISRKIRISLSCGEEVASGHINVGYEAEEIEIEDKGIDALFAHTTSQIEHLQTTLDGRLTMQSATQRGRQPQDKGGGYNRKSTPHNNSNGRSGHDQRQRDAFVPNFMRDYTPAPEVGPPPVDDLPGIKRCNVGRPIGKKLVPSTQEYRMGRCDKRAYEPRFNENMEIQGHHQAWAHAWKCSGEGTPRPLNAVLNR